VLTEASQIERHLAEHFAAHEGLPGWVAFVREWAVARIQARRSFVNAATFIRMEGDAEARLDELIAAFQAAGVGAGMWLTPGSLPGTLPVLLKARAFRLRRLYAAMHRPLDTRVPRLATDGWDIVPLSLRDLPRGAYALAAMHRGKRLGGCVVTLGREGAGLHDVEVDPRHRNRGIGTSLVLAACAYAQDRGAPSLGLVATGLGESVYERCGFREVARFGYWYSALTP
jgi:GNAT superfamily N-acetyltransferase